MEGRNIGESQEITARYRVMPQPFSTKQVRTRRRSSSAGAAVGSVPAMPVRVLPNMQRERNATVLWSKPIRGLRTIMSVSREESPKRPATTPAMSHHASRRDRDIEGLYGATNCHAQALGRRCRKGAVQWEANEEGYAYMEKQARKR